MRAVPRIHAALPLLLLACGAPQPKSTQAPPRPAPVEAELRLARLDDAEAPLRKKTLSAVAENRPVLIFYFARWCPVCVAELPALERLSRDVRVVILVVPFEPTRGEAAREADWVKAAREGPLRRLNLSEDLQIALAEDAARAGQTPFGALTGVPTGVLLDAQQRPLARFTGTVPIYHILRLLKPPETP